MKNSLALTFADGRTLFVRAQSGELLLDAALRHGITLPVDCREGVCGTCRGHCESGAYRLDFVDDETLSPAELAAGAILACQTRIEGDAVFAFDIDSARCAVRPPVPRGAVVTGLTRIGNAAVMLDMQLEGPPLAFLPGQYARLTAPGWTTSRAYSFANKPNESNHLRFLIRRLEGGLMGTYLDSECAIGAQLTLTGPFGSFYCRASDRPLVFAAGGTGLAAFLGMIEELAASPTPPPALTLYYGVNHPGEFCAQPELAAWEARLPWFRRVQIVAQPPAGYEGLCGYVTDHFDQAEFLTVPDVYVCGPPPMVEAVTSWMRAHGPADAHVYFEKFVGS